MISVILLAGGTGSRFGNPTPKQFLPLKGKPVACHSLDVFSQLPDVKEIIVVCDEQFRSLFSEYSLTFANPGQRRQDSLYNGFQKATGSHICVHDAARPLINTALCKSLFAAGLEVGAATLGIPATSTLKEVHLSGEVIRTLDRSKIYEIQTPQIVSRAILEEGFALATSTNQSVTDDVSFAELLGKPVQIVLGADFNIKITTPSDFPIAEHLWTRRG